MSFPEISQGVQFRARSPKRLWYQHRVEVAEGRGGGDRSRGRRRPGEGERIRVTGDRLLGERVDTRSVRCLTSARRESIEPEGVTADTLGGAMSTNLSASSAISSRVLSAADEVSTVRTFVGRRWRKSSRKRGPSAAVALSPSNCRIRRSSCVGLRSPNSKEWRTCWSLRRSGGQVRWMSCCLSVSYGLSGTWRMMSRTSVANSGDSEATT